MRCPRLLVEEVAIDGHPTEVRRRRCELDTGHQGRHEWPSEGEAPAPRAEDTPSRPLIVIPPACKRCSRMHSLDRWGYCSPCIEAMRLEFLEDYLEAT